MKCVLRPFFLLLILQLETDKTNVLLMMSEKNIIYIEKKERGRRACGKNVTKECQI